MNSASDDLVTRALNRIRGTQTGRAIAPSDMVLECEKDRLAAQAGARITWRRADGKQGGACDRGLLPY